MYVQVLLEVISQNANLIVHHIYLELYQYLKFDNFLSTRYVTFMLKYYPV